MLYERELGWMNVVMRCDKDVEEIIAILPSWRLGLDSRLHFARTIEQVDGGRYRHGN